MWEQSRFEKKTDVWVWKRNTTKLNLTKTHKILALCSCLNSIIANSTEIKIGTKQSSSYANLTLLSK